MGLSFELHAVVQLNVINVIFGNGNYLKLPFRPDYHPPLVRAASGIIINEITARWRQTYFQAITEWTNTHTLCFLSSPPALLPLCSSSHCAASQLDGFALMITLLILLLDWLLGSSPLPRDLMRFAWQTIYAPCLVVLASPSAAAACVNTPNGTSLANRRGRLILALNRRAHMFAQFGDYDDTNDNVSHPTPRSATDR